MRSGGWLGNYPTKDKKKWNKEKSSTILGKWNECGDGNAACASSLRFSEYHRK